MATVMDSYRARLQEMTDKALEEEWEKTEGVFWTAVEHEMAMRFRGRAKSQMETRREQTYLQKKLLRMGKEFQEAYYRKEWGKAKYLYDSAERIAVFIEAPQEVFEQLFWKYDESTDTKTDGLFDSSMINKVMHECIVKNRLGFECIVYRAPGELGYFGARQLPGTKRMEPQENPAYTGGQ